MLSPEARARRAQERAEVEAYLAGTHAAAFTLLRREEYCVCDVLFPNVARQLALQYRFAVAGLATLVPGSFLKCALYRLLGVKIGRGVYISPGALIDPFYPRLVVLEDDCFLGLGCRLFTHEYTAANFRLGSVRIGKGAVVGAHASVRSGVTIGARATVGFNSFVNKNVPEGATVGGVPARVLAGVASGKEPAR
jgi:hypothetical protein